MQLILLILTSLVFPVLFKFLDFHIGRRTRLSDRVKATQIYYELKSKGGSPLELSRAAQAMVGSTKATEDLILHFIQIHEIDNDFSDLDIDVASVVSANKYLKFDNQKIFQKKLYFTHPLFTSAKRLRLSRLKYSYYFFCGFTALLPVLLYVKPFLTAVSNWQLWTKFLFGYQILTIWLFLFSIVWIGVWLFFAFKHLNDGDNLKDADKMMRRVSAKLETIIDVVELKEKESKLDTEGCTNDQYSPQL